MSWKLQKKLYTKNNKQKSTNNATDTLADSNGDPI